MLVIPLKVTVNREQVNILKYWCSHEIQFALFNINLMTFDLENVFFLKHMCTGWVGAVAWIHFLESFLRDAIDDCFKQSEVLLILI